ncbi:hypothetical protein [Aquimarina sp. I32.4]|uniref:hypothetical protein n=1 Tax=Aquimarina sp. I32.4 TaxID=2053903 RepID=UPI0011AF1B23|nr:hypothetical protein [Aquimarina sp. I32.4]
MKNSLVTLAFLLMSLLSSAQKVKVKKGEVFIDKIKVAHIEKVKIDSSKYYQVSDVHKNPLFKAQKMSQQSLLFPKDKEYTYRAIYGDKIPDTISIKKNYWLSEKRVIAYALEIGLFSATGLDSSKIEEIVSETPKKPSWILKNLEKEKELIQNRGHKVDRKFDDINIYVKSHAQKDAISQLNKSMVSQMKFDIYQEDPNGDDILIGHAIYEYGTVKGEYLFVLNTKKVPLASYSGAVLKIYQPFLKVGPLEHNISLTNNKRNEAVRNMAIELIQRQLL